MLTIVLNTKMVRHTQVSRKRKFSGASRFTKRRKFAPRRTYRRRTYKPRYKRSGKKMPMVKRILPIHGRNALNCKYICDKTHIPYQVRSSAMQKYIWRTAGDPHYLRWKGVGNTSALATNNPLFFNFNPSMDNSSTYSWASNGIFTGWSGNSAWGQQNYSSVTPLGYKRILWSHTFVRLLVKNINENCRVRVQFFKKTTNELPASTYVSAYETNPDVPQSQQYWKVLYSKMLTFDKPKFTGTATDSSFTNNEVRELNFFFPWNRVIQTYNADASQNASYWIGNSRLNDYLIMSICSDDATNADGEEVNIELYVEHKFYDCA